MSIKLYFFVVLLFCVPAPAFILIINPAGDSQTKGRTVHDNFERTITLQYAQKIKETLEKNNSNLSIYFTRTIGQVITPLLTANFSNRIRADLYISIHCFASNALNPSIYCYAFKNRLDIIKPHPLHFYPLDQAYLHAYDQTNKYLQQIFTHAEKYTQLHIQGPIFFPFKPLLGLTAPALAFEIGITKNNNQDIIQFLCSALQICISYPV